MSSAGGVAVASLSSWWSERKDDASAYLRPVSSGRFDVALAESGCSLMVASRSRSILATLSLDGDGRIRLSTLRCPGPMGIDSDRDTLAVGHALGIRVYRNVSTQTQVRAYVPVGTHFTSAVSVHDVALGERDDIWFVNTRFSALCVTDRRSHFAIRWRPGFIEDGGPTDCCHLNGMACLSGRPRYVTALAATGRAEGWRAHVPDSGVLMDVEQNVLADLLSLPHSPRLHQDDVWLLESGRGRLLRVSPLTGARDVACEIPGVLRGLDIAGRFAFVGASPLRERSEAVSARLRERFDPPPVCRIYAVDLIAGRTVGHVDLPFADEISTVHAAPVPVVTISEGTLDHAMSTHVYRTVSFDDAATTPRKGEAVA